MLGEIKRLRLQLNLDLYELTSQRSSGANMHRLSLFLIFLSACILNQCAFGIDRTQINIGRGDVDIIYPSDYSKDQPLPVIIALHGFTGNKKQLDNYWKLSGLVDDKKFILVYPQGTRDSKGRTFWNATEACCNMENLEVDDVGYLMELLDTLELQFSVDSDSVHFIGWSNGGFMSYRIACEHSERIASFVSLAGANYKNAGVCANASPVHVLQVHGTEDQIVEYSGGCWPDEITAGTFNCYASALESVTDWAKINGCETLPKQLGPLDLDRSIPGPDTTVLLFEHKEGGAIAELWSVHGAGHGPVFNQRYTNMVVDWLLLHRRIGEKQIDIEKKSVMSPPSDEIIEEFKLDSFYRKCLLVNGMPIVASEHVRDESLFEAEYLIRNMIGHRPDILSAMAQNKTRFAIMSPTEFTTDIPEHSDLEPKGYWDKRSRGLGATAHRPAVSCGEENLLCLPGDPYSTENILVHEFAHAIHEMGLVDVDPEFDKRLEKIYTSAMDNGLYKDTYAATNRMEYWAESVQSWFYTNRENDAEHNFVNTREELKEYDPKMAGLIEEIFLDESWRYIRPENRQETIFTEVNHDGRKFFWPPEVTSAYEKSMLE